MAPVALHLARTLLTLLGLAGYDDFEPTTPALALDVIERQRDRHDLPMHLLACR